jgi:transcriptional regulator with XRE-family HTH domain
MEPISPHHLAVGRAIRHLRGELGVSQEKLAAKCNLDRSFMGGIERGERNFSFAKLVTISAALETTPSRVLVEYERQLQALSSG